MARFGEFIVNHWMLFTLLVVVLVMLIMNEFKRQLLGFKEVKPQEAVRLMNQEDAVMLDVRDDQEFAQGHVPKAVHIPLGLLDERVQELDAHKDKPIVVYCRTGQRSARAGVLLRRQGMRKLYKLSGGMLAWQEANLPVSRKK